MRGLSFIRRLGVLALALLLLSPVWAQVELDRAEAGLDRLEQLRRAEIRGWRQQVQQLRAKEGADESWQASVDTFALQLEAVLQADLVDLGAPSLVPPATRPAPIASEPPDPAALERMEAYAARAGALKAREAQLRAARAKVSAGALRGLHRLESSRTGPPTAGGYFRAAERERLLDRLRQSLRIAEEHTRRQLRGLHTLPARASAPELSRALWTACAWAVVTLVAFGLVARRKDALMRFLRKRIGRSIERPALRLSVERWVRFFLAIGPAFFWVLFLEAMNAALAPLNLGEVRLLRLLLLTWAWYRVVRDGALHLLTTWAAARDNVLGPAVRLRIMRSLRLGGRTVVGLLVVLLSLERLAGAGPLFHAAAAIAAIFLATSLLVLVAHWRVEILETWREDFEGGRLARLAHRSEAHPTFETLVALILGLALVVVLFVRGLRDLALRFTRVRRLFAAFERRKLERRGETAVSGDDDLARLPDAIQDALGEGPIAPAEALPHFPGLTEARLFFEQRADRGTGGSLALVGEPGSGRRSWLRALGEACKDIPTTELTLPRRPTSATEVCEQLIAGLSLECEATPDAVVAALEARPLTRIVVRNPKLLALRCMGGLRTFETFLEIIGRSAERVQWICVFPAGLWRFLSRVYNEVHLFQQVCQLGPWSEEQIDELISRRMRRAKVVPRYQISVVDNLDGTAFDTEVVHTARRYHRLIWDYADGNPAAALHFWLRSLSVDPETGEVVARLFRAPDGAALDRLDERSRFALACVALHDGISIPDAARALGYSVGETEALLENLRESGVLEERDRHLKLSTHWQRAVLRFLRQRHLVAA
ncbi:MAG: hypothetical protein P1V51_15315 [Deltaproteobacteria bacterium]|nr:hypothetical protein [Deltaproteobacteria bacterium]